MIINNKTEFEEVFPYGKKYIKKYPEEYPCIVKVVSEDSGLMGENRRIYVAYIPKKVTIKQAFIKGINCKWNEL